MLYAVVPSSAVVILFELFEIFSSTQWITFISVCCLYTVISYSIQNILEYQLADLDLNRRNNLLQRKSSFTLNFLQTGQDPRLTAIFLTIAKLELCGRRLPVVMFACISASCRRSWPAVMHPLISWLETQGDRLSGGLTCKLVLLLDYVRRKWTIIFHILLLCTYIVTSLEQKNVLSLSILPYTF